MGLIDQMMANLYKPPKQEKTNTILPKNLTPAKVAYMMNQTNVTQGQLLKGEVLDLRANQILVLLENGTTVSARTEGTLPLSIGQHAKFFVAQTTEDQILLKLAKEDTPAENPMIDKALNAANIQKTERSVSIVTELLAHQQPVNEAGIRHYLSLSARHPELPVKNLILMELHHIPVTKENVEQFVAYQDRNAKLLTQAQDMLQNLAKNIEQIPEGPVKQEVMQELRQLVGNEVHGNTAAPNTETQAFPPNAGVPSPQPALQSTEQTPMQTDIPAAIAEHPTTATNVTEAETNPIAQQDQNVSVSDSEAGSHTEAQKQTPDTQTTLQPDTPDTSGTTESVRPPAEHFTRTDAEPLLREFFDSFLLKPEEVADPEKVQKYYDELNEKLDKLEQLSQKLSEQTAENNGANAPKQMRQNLSFMEAVNNVFPYIQLPLKFRETPAHGELYVYEKKKALKPSDSLSALLHLELEALGTTDIYVTLTGHHVTTRFSMTDKESGDLVRTEMPKLTEALAAKGYTLQSEIAVREPSEENTPTLLEQFLEEHAPGGLNRSTCDIRA